MGGTFFFSFANFFYFILASRMGGSITKHNFHGGNLHRHEKGGEKKGGSVAKYDRNDQDEMGGHVL